MGIKDQPKFFDWETPPDDVDRIHRAFGSIALDPCTSIHNPTRAQRFYAPFDASSRGGFVGPQGPGWAGPCGLRGPWWRSGLLYVNCRYGRFLAGEIVPDAPVYYTIDNERVLVGYGTGWALKFAQDQGEKLALLPCSPDAPWWQMVNASCTWRVDTKRRLAFVDPRTGKQVRGNKAGSTWFYGGSRLEAFREHFAELGTEAPAPAMLNMLLRR